MSQKRQNVETLINRPDFADAVAGSSTWVRAALQVVATLEYDLQKKD